MIISDNYFKDKINNSNRTPYCDICNTPMNISNYKIRHNKKENILKLKKNKGNISNLSIKTNNTINNSYQNSCKK